MAVLQLKGVTKAFGEFFSLSDEGAYVALRDVDLAVEDGQFVCILGPSGCGKSTLLNIVAGFEPATLGSAELDGRPIRGPGSDRVVFFQDASAALFPWMSAEDNVSFGLRMKGIGGKEQRALADRYLALVGLKEHRKKYPAELSGGMRQRIQIARGLVLDPRILLMDEPFGALDSQTRRRMQEELLRIWEATRKTVVFVTHDIGESILLADRIAVMTAGPEARIKNMIDVGLARPRDPLKPDFVRLFRDIEQMLHEEGSDDE